MSRIKLISDLHLDAELVDPTGKKFLGNLPKENVDILVFAGDIVTNGHIEEYFDEFKYLADNYPHVVYVLGNHDAYKHTLVETYEIMNDVQSRISNFYWLQNAKKEIDGTTFIGTTLWFPDLGRVMPGKNSWIDFRMVQNGIKDIFEEYEKSKEYLENNLKENDILITHHLGSNKLVDERYAGDMYNCYFVGNIEDIVVRKKPSYYFHGHSHQSLSGVKVGDTYCYRNPRGYPYEYYDSGFDKDFIIDTALDKLK